jgi:23S rRNA-/tRNA-specific pseudouridylate synthase
MSLRHARRFIEQAPNLPHIYFWLSQPLCYCMTIRCCFRRAIQMSSATVSRSKRARTTVAGMADQYEKEIVIDDPCWGSPRECSLSHLLARLDRHKSILFESQDYLVLNKPPDLRMDGEYPATVHKLLMYWFPPQSLLLECGDYVDDDALTRDQRLLDRISTRHQNSNQDPDCLRPCHQLDYATSGVLLKQALRQQGAPGL